MSLLLKLIVETHLLIADDVVGAPSGTHRGETLLLPWRFLPPVVEA
jgi:hypothetical protein